MKMARRPFGGFSSGWMCRADCATAGVGVSVTTYMTGRATGIGVDLYGILHMGHRGVTARYVAIQDTCCIYLQGHAVLGMS